MAAQQASCFSTCTTSQCDPPDISIIIFFQRVKLCAAKACRAALENHQQLGACYEAARIKQQAPFSHIKEVDK